MALLNIQNWSLHYGDQAILTSLNFSMQAGTVASILGSNGAGKSSLLKSILGLTEAAASYTGDIVIDGTSVLSEAQLAREKMAYVPEQSTVYGHLSAIENIEYLLRIAGQKPTKGLIESNLKQVGLNPEAWHQPSQSFSKGMKQKVMLALALTKKARLLLLDEPNSGLDPNATEELNQLIIQCKQFEMGVLVVTHDILSAISFSDQLFILKNASLSPIELSSDAVNMQTLKTLYQHD